MSSFFCNMYFGLVIEHYGKKKSVTVQTSKVKACFFPEMLWSHLERLRFCAQSCRVSAHPRGLVLTAGTHLPAGQGSWEHCSAQGVLLCACQSQSCWQQGADSDLDLSFKTRDLYNLMEREQFCHASLK